jgi:allantoinase
MEHAFPNVNFRREVTLGHLMLDHDAPTGVLAKVNPPIRAREDVEYMWQAIADGKLDWVVSDHACCRHELKVDGTKAGDIFLAKSGFGGTEYLLPGMVSEGTKRGLPLHRIAELVAWNPARRFGLEGKGDLAPGFDADIALVNPAKTWTIRSADSESSQGYTPFEGIELSAAVEETYLRGRAVWRDGRAVGAPSGRYLHRSRDRDGRSLLEHGRPPPTRSPPGHRSAPIAVASARPMRPFASPMPRAPSIAGVVGSPGTGVGQDP